jgi:hypothetical protein
VTVRVFLLAALVGAVSCRPARGRPESLPTTSASDPPTPAQLLSNCVIDTGQSKTTKFRERKPGGELGVSQLIDASCLYYAECGLRHGEDNPGDGSAELSCSEGQCLCRLEPVFSAAVEWRFQAACTSPEEAKQLLRDVCLKGVHIAN